MGISSPDSRSSVAGARRRAACAAWRGLLVSLLLAGCGPAGSSGGGAMPSATPPPAPSPAPTATAVPAIAAMALRESGRAVSVNADGWISFVDETPRSVIGFESVVVWAPDAPRPARPLPALPCTGAPPEECIHRFPVLLEVGDDGWTYGYDVRFGSGGPFVPLPALFGPDRATDHLFDVALESPPVPLDTIARDLEAHLCPGPRVAGALTLRGGESLVQVPVLWPAPGATAVFLPHDGGGAVATDCDADGRVSGASLDPPRAVVWLPSASSYHLALLPADAARPSAALAIDEGRIVGWRTGADGTKPVAWTARGDAFTAEVLPDPADARCEKAVATSGARIAGDCGAGAVVWRGAADGAAWQIEAKLLPLPGDPLARVLAMSGDLAVGWSGASESRATPVAWRLVRAPDPR